ncbi:hypothetical protein [Halobaculum sp. MBLA0143]|uniref:DUF7857 domain-containing protein n=1 Tax=Halobaculum sp. MBLA0143 TaxID=3079933 RepID=UPI0035242B26
MRHSDDSTNWRTAADDSTGGHTAADDSTGGRTTADDTTVGERAVELEADATVLRGMALVTCRLHNRTGTVRAVRLRDRLPGATLPPRRDGVPERGWTDGSYTTVLPAYASRAVGYASPVGDERPTEPAEVAAVGDPATLSGDGDRVRHARRELDDWAPPRAVVDGATASVAVGESTGPAAVDAAAASVAVDGGTAADDGRAPPVPAEEPFADGAVPTAVAAYLEAAAERVERAAATEAGVPEATAALRDTHHTPATLEQAVARDETALRILARRAEELADRAAEATVPVDSLRRLS